MAESAAARFTRDIDSRGDDLSEWNGSAYVTNTNGRKEKEWDGMDLERREREYVDAATGLNAEGAGPYNGE
jgi:hypothetical protein